MIVYVGTKHFHLEKSSVLVYAGDSVEDAQKALMDSLDKRLFEEDARDFLEDIVLMVRAVTDGTEISPKIIAYHYGTESWLTYHDDHPTSL